MNYRNTAFASCILLGLCMLITSQQVGAQSMDVDQADGIDFESFHKDKKEAIKVWDKKSNTPTKTYSEQSTTPATSATTSVTTGTTTPDKNSTSSAKNIAPAADENMHGKRFELRERYTLTRSTQTPYSAFYVIEPLYKQAAQLCAKGWKKLAERSEPIEQDFYLYFEIECL